MTEPTTIRNETELPTEADGPVRVLVPVRDPATPPSKQTLDRAKALVDPGGELIIVHVNLYYKHDSTRWADLKQSISPSLGDIDANYVVRRGANVEDVILEEAVDNDVDLIVVGKNAQPRWRRAINRALKANIDVANTLHERASCAVEVVD